MQLVSVLVIVSLAGAAHAPAWRVELNGGGDYTDIQPAVEAAAPGDTIRIGPGRYATFHPITAPAWTEDTIVGVLKDNLHFIGSGQDVTFLGPDTFLAPSGMNPKVFCSFGGYSATLSDMTIENVETGVYWAEGVLAVSACRFRSQDYRFFALDLMVDDGIVRDCRFDLPSGGSAIGVMNILNNMRGIEIDGCTISGAQYGLRVSYGAPNVNIHDCDLAITYWGIVFDQLSTGSIRRCHVSGGQQGGFLGINGSSVSIVDSEFVGGRRGLNIAAGANITGSGIVLSGTTEAAVTISGGGRASIHGSDLLPAVGWAVNCLNFTGAAVVVDFSDNYWGTADAGEIEALIHDSRYYSPNPYMVVYAPYANAPVPVESTSWGDLKALFR